MPRPLRPFSACRRRGCWRRRGVTPSRTSGLASRRICYCSSPGERLVVCNEGRHQGRRRSTNKRAVAILPMGKGMVCHTLHEPRELYDAKPLFESIADAKPDPEMIKLATQLIERQQGKFTPGDTEDHYETRLREVIAAKLKGEGITPQQTEAPARDNVIDLMAALKASLGRGEPTEQTTPDRRKSAPAKRKAAAKRKAPARRRA